MPDRERILQALKTLSGGTGARALLGFDAYVDLIVRPIRIGSAIYPESYYERMESLGRFIIERSGRNGSLELDIRYRRLGGNAPNVAAALGCFGIAADLIGPFGEEETDPVFRRLQERGRLYSTGDPGLSYALEFTDGKIFLAMNEGNNFISWDLIRRRLGLEKVLELAGASSLLYLVNWSELPDATSIFRGFAQEILPALEGRRPLMIDLADCTRKGLPQLLELLELIRSMAPLAEVTLSLNQNESDRVCRVLRIPVERTEPERATLVREWLGIQAVAFHNRDENHLATAEGCCSQQTIDHRPTVLTTGAGDNFNAGLGLGSLLGLPAAERLFLATMVSEHYVVRGSNASLTELIRYIHEMWGQEEKRK
ncbi:MAG: hypothetical protein QM296_08155 [Bacillota bacterium]|nr:hypothetical protein [Bacillota bacterium]